MSHRFSIFSIFIIFFLNSPILHAQSGNKINWISFNQLNDSLKVKPKKVFVDFYADWCRYCKEMEKTTFQAPDVITELNDNYYAVRMDVETEEVVEFGNQTFINKRKKRMNPVHDLALLLASRKDHPFSLPAYVLFDENFVATSRYFQYLDVKAMLKILEKDHITTDLTSIKIP